MTGSGLRKTGILFAVTALTLFLAGCSGGGGATSSSGSVTPSAPVGPAAVEISLGAAPVTGSAAAAAPVTVAGPASVPSLDPSYLWPEHVTDPTPRIAHVYMDVVKVSLMPAEEPFGGEDMDGEIREDNSADSECPVKPHFVTLVPDSPIRIDLLNLENGKKLARFLNKFDRVPAGTYDKIRVYYQNVKVVLADGGNLRFHPTANSKFDIHFREGHELVIPATADSTQPDGWVQFFRVKLDVVGLKLKITGGGKSWKGCKVILRPQIFAEFVSPILYSVAGTAANVNGFTSPAVSGTFDVVYGTGPGYPRTIHAAFDNRTNWAWSDNVLGASFWIVDLVNTAGFGSFRDRATVEAVGRFNAARIFQARDIVFAFPDVRTGAVDNGWIAPDNVAFLVRSLLDNVLVFPKPDRYTAYYDNAIVDPVDNTHPTLTQAAIDNNVEVKVRGYFGPFVAPSIFPPPSAGMNAYWISVGRKLPVSPFNP